MKFEYFQSKKDDEWYWRLRGDNGEPIADGGQGYKNKSDCLHGIDLVKGSGDAEVVEVDE